MRSKLLGLASLRPSFDSSIRRQLRSHMFVSNDSWDLSKESTEALCVC